MVRIQIHIHCKVKYRLHGTVYRVQSTGYRVQGAGYRIQTMCINCSLPDSFRIELGTRNYSPLSINRKVNEGEGVYLDYWGPNLLNGDEVQLRLLIASWRRSQISMAFFNLNLEKWIIWVLPYQWNPPCWWRVTFSVCSVVKVWYNYSHSCCPGLWFRWSLFVIFRWVFV